MRTEQVIIVGGGIVGLSAALAMAQRGHAVDLVDAGDLQVPPSVADSRVYAINQASERLLTDLGVWPRIPATALSPYRKMLVWDGINGQELGFDSRLALSSQLGHILEEKVLKQALLAALSEQPRVQLHPQTRMTALVQPMDRILVRGEDFELSGSLLMVTDGAQSSTRELLEVPLTQWSYQQTALVCSVAVEKSHQQTAWQVFNPDGPLAFLPLANPQHCSIVWSTTADQAAALLAMSEPDFNQALQTAFVNRLGAVQVLGKRSCFPLNMRHAKHYVGNRWLLMGDAAHTIHPLAGLGLNLGLADLKQWLHLSQDYPQLTQPRLLASYQRARKAEVWQVIALMEALKRLFAQQAKPLVFLRGLGLNCFNRISPLRQFLIRQAAGG